MDLSAYLSGNFSVNFASGNQDEESPSEEFDTDSEREEAVGDASLEGSLL